MWRRRQTIAVTEASHEGARRTGRYRGAGPQARRRFEDAVAAYAELSEVGYTAFSVERSAARARTGKASILHRCEVEPILDWFCSLPTPQQCGHGDGSGYLVLDALSILDSIAAVLNSPAGDAMAPSCEAAAEPGFGGDRRPVPGTAAGG